MNSVRYRDTLILREYSINLLFLIAAYGAYEDWSKPLRSEIRTDLINYVKSLYKFFEVVPEPIPLYAGDKKVGEIPFLNYHYNRLRGKVYKVNDKRLPGSPDLVLPKYRAVIFINGCFWHGHRGCTKYTVPKTNEAFWREKIAREQARKHREILAQVEAELNLPKSLRRYATREGEILY